MHWWWSNGSCCLILTITFAASVVIATISHSISPKSSKALQTYSLELANTAEKAQAERSGIAMDIYIANFRELIHG